MTSSSHKGAEVIYERGTDLDVSGHACQEELKMMYALVKPKFFIPVHGERRMLHKSGDMIVGMGHDRRNIIIGENGRVIELTAKSAKLGATVPSGRVLVDGMGVGDVGTVVLRDRKLLADEGMVVVVMTLSAENAQLISGPDIISRGFVYEKENDKLIDELRRVAMESIAYCEDNDMTDWASIKSRVKSGLSGYLFKKTRRSPMILPIIMEVKPGKPLRQNLRFCHLPCQGRQDRFSQTHSGSPNRGAVTAQAVTEGFPLENIEKGDYRHGSAVLHPVFRRSLRHSDEVQFLASEQPEPHRSSASAPLRPRRAGHGDLGTAGL